MSGANKNKELHDLALQKLQYRFKERGFSLKLETEGLLKKLIPDALQAFKDSFAEGKYTRELIAQLNILGKVIVASEGAEKLASHYSLGESKTHELLVEVKNDLNFTLVELFQ